MSQSLKQSGNDENGNEEQSEHSSNNKSNNNNDNISNNKSMNVSQALSENKQYLNTNEGRRQQLNQIELRQIQANAFENYINDTGISSAFQLIFSDPLEHHVLPYKLSLHFFQFYNYIYNFFL